MRLALALPWPQLEVLSASVLGELFILALYTILVCFVFVFWADVSQHPMRFHYPIFQNTPPLLEATHSPVGPAFKDLEVQRG